MPTEKISLQRNSESGVQKLYFCKNAGLQKTAPLNFYPCHFERSEKSFPVYNNIRFLLDLKLHIVYIGNITIVSVRSQFILVLG